MSVSFEVTLGKDGQKVVKILNDMAGRAENVEGMLEDLGIALKLTTLERFDSQTDPQGRAWVSLSALTLALKRSGKILTESGALQRSVAYKVMGHSLALGANTVYANIQQYGGTIVPKQARALRIPNPFGNKGGAIYAQKSVIPARPYIGFGAKDEAVTRKIAEDWISPKGISK